MNKNLNLAISAIVLGTISQVISALPSESKGISVRVGGMFNLNRPTVTLLNGTKNRTPQISFAGGVDYTISEIGGIDELGEPGQKSSWGISADYCANGNRYNIPVLANFRGKMDQFEYSAGVGVGFGRQFNEVSKAFENKTNLSFQLSGRYYFQKTSENPIFAEVRYYGSSKSELNGIGVLVGMSF